MRFIFFNSILYGMLAFLTSLTQVVKDDALLSAGGEIFILVQIANFFWAMLYCYVNDFSKSPIMLEKFPALYFDVLMTKFKYVKK